MQKRLGLMRKVGILSLIFQLVFAGQFVYAQDASSSETIPPVVEVSSVVEQQPTSTPDVSTPPSPTDTPLETASTSSENVDNIVPPLPDVVIATDTPSGAQVADNPQNASSTLLIQGASSGQDTVSPGNISTSTEVILATSTPTDTLPIDPVTQDATTTDPIDTSSTTDPTSVPTDVQVDTPVDLPVDALPVNQPQPDVVPVSQPDPVVITQADLLPDPEFVFSVNTGKRIPTKRIVRKQELVNGRMAIKESEEELTNEPTISADNSSGVMNISGSCEDAYYVVLLYKNQEDYVRDRRSFIFNRAFPCINRSFNYQVEDLPEALESGTYYVLIGSQGETTPWVPITGLTEVEITNR